MKISIITVVYNNEKTIRDAIESVLSQTYNNIEYIIIDGNSIDNTKKIIEEYIDRIQIFISENDNGIYDAMNKGIKFATGEVIGILNSDDLYANNSIIEKVMTQFNTYEYLDILYGDLVYVKHDNTNKIVRSWKSEFYYPQFFENGNVPPHPSLFVSSKVYKDAGYFNLKYQFASDYDFMLRIFKKFKFKILYYPTVLVHMRLGGATNNNLKNIFKGNVEILNSWKQNGYAIPFLLIPKRIIKKLIQFI